METRPEQNRIRAQAIIGIPRDHTILIVEDNEERIDYFKRWMRPEDGNFNNVTVARTPQEALVILRGFRFDIIFLDHDSINRFVDLDNPDYTELTFWKVAVMLANIKYKGMVIIHSHNPVGANRMEDLLIANGVKAQWIPFGQFKIEIT